jgi:hypothetical protein
MLGKAVEWNVIAVAPKTKLLEESGREQTIRDAVDQRNLRHNSRHSELSVQ